MTDLNGQLADMRRDLDVAERTGAELRTKIAAAEAALAASASQPAPAAEPPVYRIRLLRGGDGPMGSQSVFASHPAGSVLQIAVNDAHAAVSGMPTLSHAVDLVRLNLAEWVGAPPPGTEHMPHVAADPAPAPYFPRLDLTGGPALR